MPEKLDRCVKGVKSQGKPEGAAYAICSASTGIKRKKGGGWTKGNKKTVDEMTSAGVFGPSEIVSNTDSYAPGDTRIPKSIFGGVQTRNGIKKKKRKNHLREALFVIKDYPRKSMVECHITITSKNLERITEDILSHTKQMYSSTRTPEGYLQISFEARNPTIDEIGNKICGLFGDRIGKGIHINFEKNEVSEIKMGTAEEISEHPGTIKKLKADKNITVKKGARMIARDHLKEDPKYYSKLKKCHQ